MASLSRIELLRRIAACPAMAALDDPSCAVEAAVEPLVDRDGVLVVEHDGKPARPGRPAVTLGDLVRRAVGDDAEEAIDE